MSESQTWATDVKMSTSRTIIRVRSISRGAACKPTRSTRPPRRTPTRRRRGRVRSAARLDHDVEADAVAELAAGALARSWPVASTASCGTERRRSGQSLGVDVDRDNASVDRSPCCARDDERADAADADHRDRLFGALCQPATAHAAQPQGAVSSQPRRRRNRPGPGGRSRPATSRTRRARRRPADRACGTRRTGSSETGDTSGSGRRRSPHRRRRGRPTRRPVTSAAEIDDAPDELVPEHDARTAEDGPVIPLRGVRATDRRANHLEHDLAGAGRAWVRDLLDADVVRPVEDSRLHVVSTRSEPSRCGSCLAPPRAPRARRASGNVAVSSGVGSMPLVAMKRIVRGHSPAEPMIPRTCSAFDCTSPISTGAVPPTSMPTRTTRAPSAAIGNAFAIAAGDTGGLDHDVEAPSVRSPRQPAPQRAAPGSIARFAPTSSPSVRRCA